MDLRRLFKHWMMTGWQVRRAFPESTVNAVEDAVRRGEAAHGGEFRFAVEGALHSAALLHGQTARERALEVFSDLRVWDTEANNGVLIYLLLADRDVEIVADRGINAKVGKAEWAGICRQMEAAFQQGLYEQGIVDGIAAVTNLLAQHFPALGAGGNELPNRPVLL